MAYFNVAIANDLSIPTFTMHEQSGLPFGGGFPVPAYPTVEAVCPIFWPPGMAMGANKLSMTVLHRGCGIMQQGHDCGPGILHVAAPPYLADALDVVHTLFSSRSPLIDAQRVRTQGSATAAGTLPMMACADFTALPTGWAPTAMMNSVQVGVTGWDVLRCLSAALVKGVTDWLLKSKLDRVLYLGKASNMFDIMGRARAPITRRVLGASVEQFRSELLKKLIGDNAKDAVIKAAVGSATGFIRSLGGPETTIGVSSPGNPFFGASTEVSYKDGEVHRKTKGRLHHREVQWKDGDEAPATSHMDNLKKHSINPLRWGKVIA